MENAFLLGPADEHSAQSALPSATSLQVEIACDKVIMVCLVSLVLITKIIRLVVRRLADGVAL